MDSPPEPPARRSRSDEFRGRRAASNTVVVAVGQFAVVAIALVTTPVALNHIGLAEFGIWSLVVTTITYLTVLDPGFTDIVTRYGAQARMRGETRVAARICALGTLFWLAFGAVLTPLVWWLVPVVVHHYRDLTAVERSQSISFFYWSWAILVFGSILSTISGRLVAIGDQWLVTVIDVVTRFIYAGVLIGLLLDGRGLFAIVIATGVQYLLSFVITMIAIALRDGVPYASPRGLDRDVLRELYRFGGLLQFNSILDTLTNDTDTLVIGTLVGAIANGLFAITQRLARQITYFAYIPQANVLPAMAASHAAEDENVDDLARMFVRAQRIVVLLGAFLAGAVVAFGPVILRAWLGHPYRAASVATVLVALTMMAGLPRPVTANAILAMGRIGLGVRAQILAFVVNAVLTFTLVWPLGWTGVLIGTLAARASASGYLLIRFSRMMHHPFRTLCASWLVPLAMITAVTAGAGRLAMWCWPAAQHHELTALVALVVLGVGYSILYGLGLRWLRFFSFDDLVWLRGTAPGPLGRVLHPRVVRWLSRSSS